MATVYGLISIGAVEEAQRVAEKVLVGMGLDPSDDPENLPKTRRRRPDSNHFGEYYTLEQVGLCLGVTRERVRQIERRALAKLARMYAEQKQDLL